MASRWHRRSAAVIHKFLSLSPAATAMSCKQRIRASRSCASRSNYRLWKNSFVKPWNVTGSAIVVTTAWCNSHEGRARLRLFERNLNAARGDASSLRFWVVARLHWPFAARAQQGDRMRRVGVLLPAAANDPEFQARMRAFQEGLEESGWSIGRNVHIDVRWTTTADATTRPPP